MLTASVSGAGVSLRYVAQATLASVRDTVAGLIA